MELRVESPALSTSVAYSLQEAVSRSGEDAGKRLKAIPRHALTGSAALRPLPVREQLELSIALSHQSGMYFDDANTRKISGFTRVDGRLGFRLGGFGFHLSGRNLFDRRYSSSGYLDPSGSGEAYLYPAAGRVLEAGITRGW